MIKKNQAILLLFLCIGQAPLTISMSRSKAYGNDDKGKTEETLANQGSYSKEQLLFSLVKTLQNQITKPVLDTIKSLTENLILNDDHTALNESFLESLESTFSLTRKEASKLGNELAEFIKSLSLKDIQRGRVQQKLQK